jgi:hypothetical protein
MYKAETTFVKDINMDEDLEAAIMTGNWKEYTIWAYKQIKGIDSLIRKEGYMHIFVYTFFSRPDKIQHTQGLTVKKHEIIRIR